MPQETGGSDLAGCIGTYLPVPYFVLDDVLDRCAVSRRRRVSSRHSGRFNKRARAAPVVCGSVRCRDTSTSILIEIWARDGDEEQDQERRGIQAVTERKT